MHAIHAFVALASLATFAQADQLSITTSKDNTLYEDQAGMLSNGAGDGCFAGRAGPGGGGGIRRAVLAFDLSSIPFGSTITAVSLQLNCSQSNSGNVTVSLHSLLADWGEGTSVASSGGGGGTAPTTNDATWIHTFFPGALWTSAGGDFIATPTDSIVIGGAATYVFPTSSNLVSDVQFWLDNPNQNFGWCVLGDEVTIGNAKKIDTRENATPANRPLLTITYTSSTVAYCTAKTNSQGCAPSIAGTGVMSATATSGFTLSASNELNNKVGLVLYSEFGRDASAFGPGGILCVKAPTRRSKGFNSGGNPPPTPDCSGVFLIDFNTFGRGLLGTPPNPAPYLSVPGQVVTAQFWGRDPGFAAPNNFSLSNGLEFVVAP